MSIMKSHADFIFLKQKYPVPEDWPYEQARQLFKTPEVTPAADVEVIVGIYICPFFFHLH